MLGIRALRPRRTPRRSTRQAWTFSGGLESLESRVVMSVAIQYDYTYDNSGFFANNPAAKTVLEQAAAIIGGGLHDSLTAITPNAAGGNNWSITFANPSSPRSGSLVTVKNPTVAANTLLVYVGGFASPTSGYSYYTGAGESYSGSKDFIQNINSRGQAGALGAKPTDTSPWGGMLTFSANSNWSFAGTGGTPGAGRYDFLSVAEQMLVSTLGFGTSLPWTANVDLMNRTFTGTHASVSNGGPVPLATDSNGMWSTKLSSNGK
ncbi:hypothetical protein ACYOEI_14505, partial [Singulisphaera rosea]